MCNFKFLKKRWQIEKKQENFDKIYVKYSRSDTLISEKKGE